MARKPHFTAQELSVLVDEVEKRKLILMSKFKNAVTNADKKNAWDEIADRVTSAGLGYRRNADNVRQKWRDFSSITKTKAATLRREKAKTGRGKCSLPDLTPLEERVLGVLGPEAVEGVPGGVDMCALTTAHESSMSSASSMPLPLSPSLYSGEPSLLPSSSRPLTTEPPSTTQSTTSTTQITTLTQQTLEASPSPVPQESPESSVTESLPSPQRRIRVRRRNVETRCDCSEALLRSEREKIAVLRAIREELAALREQNERHHSEVMAQRTPP